MRPQPCVWMTLGADSLLLISRRPARDYRGTDDGADLALVRR
jgi:hypothetical protein